MRKTKVRPQVALITVLIFVNAYLVCGQSLIRRVVSSQMNASHKKTHRELLRHIIITKASTFFGSSDESGKLATSLSSCEMTLSRTRKENLPSISPIIFPTETNFQSANIDDMFQFTHRCNVASLALNVVRLI